MANPRKFSEKISLHMHRQAEETARFEQIMKEVSVATARVHAADKPAASVTAAASPEAGVKNHNQLAAGGALGAFRGGSLPNVSAPECNAPIIKPEDSAPQANMSPHSPHSPHHAQAHNATPTHFRESRARSQGGPIRRPQDRKHDTSPYSSGPFLSPPPDTSWRRTNSDSALHQSAMQGMGNERTDQNRWMQNMNGPSLHHHDQHDPNRRPRSSCDGPRVPGINIFHTEYEPGTVPIPIGNNTGSLPDLTSVHSYPSPLHTPLDPDQEHQGSSPYSSSPVNTSPSTLSPTSVPPGVRTQGGRFQFNTPPPVSTHQTHLSVPVNSRYLHHNKGVTIDNGSMTQIDGHQDFTQMTNMNRIYQQQQQQQVPPTSPSPTLQQVAGYRSPRPSPQSSPSLGGRHSAPCSPGAPSPLSPLPNDYQLYNQHQAAQLQQHFEQISMDWAQLVATLVESGCTWSAQVEMDTPVNSYMSPQTNNVHYKTDGQQQQSGAACRKMAVMPDITVHHHRKSSITRRLQAYTQHQILPPLY
ncbi:CREB-regulated transcription coactivator 1 isoform X1 [Atheta coriaria]|uniref:CREB-regulated transcription coactivator 1 isoform X1 n=1 Tax=Dalotia coriaria TaxID=877792 RepID=UPI0031F3400D